MMWAILKKWASYEPVEILRESAVMVRYADPRRRSGESRCDKAALFPWRGDEATARALCAKLTSARSEYDRRAKSANDWFTNRIGEIFASGMEAATADETVGLGPEGDSPAREAGDAQ